MQDKREQMKGITERPEKKYLEESDLILRLNLPSDEGTCYFVIENKEKPELLAEMRYYHQLYGKSRETTIDEFLRAQGARLIPWYDTAGLMVEHPVNFYDAAYDYDNGVSDVSELSAMEQAELLINRAEYGEAIFNDEDRNLIMDYTFKFDNVKDTKALIHELKEAMEAPYIGEYLEVREHALEEIASLPDARIGLSEMHQAGYDDDAILPLNLGRAIELHRAGENVYSLHKDGSRTLMITEQDILEGGTLFGIEAREWERYRVIENISTERPLISRYFVSINTYEEITKREYQYFPDFDSAVTAYAKIPNHLDKEIGIESTEKPPSRLRLLICKNGMDTVEDMGSASTGSKWMHPELQEAVRRIKLYLDYHDQEIAYQVKENYIIIQTVDDGFDYTMYDKDFRELDGGVCDNTDYSIKEALEDILEDEMEAAFEDCKVIDLEEFYATVDRAEVFPQGPYMALKELMNSGEDEIAFICGYGYIYVQKIPEGYNYIAYDCDCDEISGDVYDIPEAPMEKVVEWIFKEEGLLDILCEPFDVEELKKVALLEEKERLKEEKFTPTSQCGRVEPALGWQCRHDIEAMVLNYAQEKIEEMGLKEEVKLLGSRVYGSRTREGLYREDSDVDVVLLYSGNIREDAFFNVLHEDGAKVEGLLVDINPVFTNKAATLEEFMDNAETYLDVKGLQKLAADIDQLSFRCNGYDDNLPDREKSRRKIYSDLESGEFDHIREWVAEIAINENGYLSEVVEDAKKLLIRIEQEQEKNRAEIVSEPKKVDAKISFYVAECMEYPVLGEYHDNLTLQEAVELYEKIPTDRINAIKGIGFRLEDGSMYDEKYVLLKADVISRDLIEHVPHYKESPLVQKAVSELEELLPQKQQKKKAVAPMERESVLNTLRDHREKLKAQEQKNRAQKSQNQKKGERDL